MNKLKTSTVLSCANCKTPIPMFEECWVDGIIYYHDRCKPEVKTMIVKTEPRTVETEEE